MHKNAVHSWKNGRKRSKVIMDENALFERMDKIINLLERAAKVPTLLERIVQGAATGAGILGILSAIDVVKSWLGG